MIHTQNEGISAARNRGITSSKGSFIFFLDSDDFIEKNALSLLITCYKNTKADMIIGNFRKVKNGVVELHGVLPVQNLKLLNKQEIIACATSYLRKPNKHLLFVFVWGKLFN